MRSLLSRIHCRANRLARYAMLLSLVALQPVCSQNRPDIYASYATPHPPLPRIQREPWYSAQHHSETGFQNIWPAPPPPSFGRVMKWVLPHLFKERNFPPVAHIRTDPAIFLKKTDYIRITWGGHDFTAIQMGSRIILTDPITSPRASPVGFAGPTRKTPLPFEIADLPRVDLVVISHNHYDHLDEATVKKIDRLFHPVFLVPLGLGALLRSWSITEVVEMDWWESTAIDGIRVYCTPARHFSGRTLFDRNRTLWASWYIRETATGASLYFAGDSGYGPHFREIRDRLGVPDVALLPIGAYLPRWLMQEVHLDPRESLEALRDLGSRSMIPVHWGTFDLAEETLSEPPRTLLRAAHEEKSDLSSLYILPVGGSLDLPRPAP